MVLTVTDKDTTVGALMHDPVVSDMEALVKELVMSAEESEILQAVAYAANNVMAT